MGLQKQNLRMFSLLYNQGYLKNIHNVLEFGSQDFGAIPSDIGFFLRSIGKNKEELTKSYKKQGGRTIKEIIRRNSSFSAKVLYEWLGIMEYESIDADGKWGAKIFDLNEDLGKKYNYKKQFDLTTNHGNSEHVFNQYMFFKNMHDLTKEGGFMIHMLPLKIDLDHCFYHYTTSFFRDLIIANKYKLIKRWVFNEGLPAISQVSDSLINEMYKDREVQNFHICYFLQKVNSNKFKTPFQGNCIYEDDNKIKDYIPKRSFKEKFRISAIDAIRKMANIKFDSKIVYP